jgi:hypothetical protein
MSCIPGNKQSEFMLRWFLVSAHKIILAEKFCTRHRPKTFPWITDVKRVSTEGSWRTRRRRRRIIMRRRGEKIKSRTI